MKKLILGICICSLSLLIQPLSAQKPVKKTVKVKVHKSHSQKSKVVKVKTVKRYPRSKVVVVKKRQVRTIQVLPVGYTTIIYKNRNYYHHGGYFYNYSGNNYVIIAPPRGLRIKTLPIGYKTIVVGGVNRYYYRGVYYRPVESQYETFEPAVGTVVPELPDEDVDEVTIDGITYYEYGDTLYKKIVTADGVKYEVVGKLDD